MLKLKVMTILGTRPELIRLSRVISKLDEHCQHFVVHTGQNYDYELTELFLRDLKLREPNIFLNAAEHTPIETICKTIAAADKVLEQFKPEALLLLGDTNSGLVAIAAKRRKIPIFHMEAGNRCFDFRVPEEINRRIIDHLSDVNLTYSDIARDYLLREGFPPDQVIKIGSPMREVIEYYRTSIDLSDVMDRIRVKPKKYFMASFHREENVDVTDNLEKILTILNGLAEKYQEPIIVSTHPRTRKRLEKFNLQTHPLIQFLKPFGFFDYIKLQMNAHCVLSDSGTITEESSILNFPAINLREVNERPEGFEEGAVMMVGLSLERVLQAISIVESQPREHDRLIRLVSDYSSDNVSEKILRIIHSYTDFIQMKVWKNK